ncbi:MAG: ABC transporter permease [Candidatus Aminicenantes bacterium]|nr:ABC transporter permease [Candidatus Aminicenantes bacterium]
MARIARITRESFRVMGANRTRVFIMMLGMAVGVASLTLMICVSKGAYEEVMDIVNRQGPDLLQVRPGTDKHTGLPSGSRAVVSLLEEDVDAILQHIGNIRAISPVKDRKEVEVKHGDKFTLTRIFGITPVWSEIRDFGPSKGEFISEEDLSFAARVCIIGQTVKKNLFGDTDPIGQTIRIKDVPFTVKGELQWKGISSAGRDRDDRIVVPITAYTKRLFRDIYLTQIVITVADISNLDKTIEDVRSVLRERHKISAGEPDDFAMRTPQDLIDLAYSTTRSLINLLTGIAGVSLLVAGIVIMNIMLASVSARRNEIGIRRAIGAKKRDIISQFVMEGFLISMMGGLLGTMLGFGGSIILSYLKVAASRVTLLALAASIVSCSLIAVVFGIYPAKKAANQSPVDALRT